MELLTTFTLVICLCVQRSLSNDLQIKNLSNGEVLKGDIYGCSGTTLDWSCEEASNGGITRPDIECNCQDDVDHNFTAFIATNTMVKSSQTRKLYCSLPITQYCLRQQTNFDGDKRVKILCFGTPGIPEVTHINLITTCGPETFEVSFQSVLVSRHSTSYKYLCPIPKGTHYDFIYTWYKDVVSSSNIMKLLPKQPQILLIGTESSTSKYICVVRNRFTNQTAQFELTVNVDQSSLLWILVATAIIMIFTIPTIFYLYFKKTDSTFELQNICRNNVLFSDVLKYFSSHRQKESGETGSIISLQSNCPRVIILGETQSSMTDTPSIVVSLPFDSSESQHRMSMTFRNSRARTLRSLDLTPLYKRPSRMIAKKPLKRYMTPQRSWIATAIRNVERWNTAGSWSPESSHHDLNTIDEGSSAEMILKEWNTKLAVEADRMTRSFVPCTKEEWLQHHRCRSGSLVWKSTDKRFDQDITGLTMRLIEIYKIVYPGRRYFQKVDKLSDTFGPIINDPFHRNYKMTRSMWDNYVDIMFTVTTDVTNFNKLGRKILDQAFQRFGDPSKIAKMAVK